MRISDWSSDVCSSDPTQHRTTQTAELTLVRLEPLQQLLIPHPGFGGRGGSIAGHGAVSSVPMRRTDVPVALRRDRKRVVWGKTVSVSLDLGGRRIIKTQLHFSRTDASHMTTVQ